MRRLTWAPLLIAIIGAVLGWLFAPIVDSKHPPSDLVPFFGGVLAGVIALGIGLYLLQRNQDNEQAFRFLGAGTIIFFAIVTVAAVLGLLPLPDASFRFVFAATVAGGAAVLTTFVLVAATNVSEQRKAGLKTALNKYSRHQRK